MILSFYFRRRRAYQHAMRFSAIAWIICVLLGVGLVGWMGLGAMPENARKQVGSGTALIGGKFTLLNAKSQTVTEKDFAGKYMLVYFGFTHCPDICPTGLLLINNAIDQLGKQGEKVVPIFISLDPERDTPKAMGSYTPHFGERIVGLTGSPEQIRQVAEAYKVYYRKAETGKNGEYLIDHSGYMYLMGPDGRYLAHFPHHISESALKDGLAKFLR